MLGFADRLRKSHQSMLEPIEQAPPRHRLRVLLVSGVAVLLAGCTILGFVYDRLDTLVGFYIEDLIDLTPEQSAQLDRTLAGNLQWHRESELQRYAAFLREFAGTVDAGLERPRLLEASRQNVAGRARFVYRVTRQGLTHHGETVGTWQRVVAATGIKVE